MKRAQPEREIQVKLVKELRKYCRVPWFAVPNGGKRHIAVATKLKAEGVNPGVPDLVFVIPPHGRFAGLELKSEKGVLSEHQMEWRQKLQAACAWWGIAHSFDEAYGILAAWGCLPSESTATSRGVTSKIS